MRYLHHVSLKLAELLQVGMYQMAFLESTVQSDFAGYEISGQNWIVYFYTFPSPIFFHHFVATDK